MPKDFILYALFGGHFLSSVEDLAAFLAFGDEVEADASDVLLGTESFAVTWGQACCEKANKNSYEPCKNSCSKSEYSLSMSVSFVGLRRE